MVIEFRLPSGAGGVAASHASAMLRKKIADWAALHNEPLYKARVVAPYRYHLTFEDEQNYTLFALTFEQGKMFSKFEIIDLE